MIGPYGRAVTGTSRGDRRDADHREKADQQLSMSVTQVLLVRWVSGSGSHALPTRSPSSHDGPKSFDTLASYAK